MQSAASKSIFVRLDMEDSKWVDRTLDVYRQIHDDEGYENCGVAIQAYLYRSEEDIRSLMQTGTRVRLCKGAYKEPVEVAYPAKKDVDASYDRLTKQLIDASLARGGVAGSADGKTPPIPLTSVERIGRSQLIPGVRRTIWRRDDGE